MQPLFQMYIHWCSGYIKSCVCANNLYHNRNPNLTPWDPVFDNTKTLVFFSTAEGDSTFGAWHLPAVLPQSSASPATIRDTYRKVTQTHNTQALSKILNNSTKMYIYLLSLSDYSYLSFVMHVSPFFFPSVDVGLNVFFPTDCSHPSFCLPSVFVRVKLWRSAAGERETAEGSVNDRTLRQHTQHLCLQTTNTTQKREPLTQCTNLFHCYTVNGPKQTSML